MSAAFAPLVALAAPPFVALAAFAFSVSCEPASNEGPPPSTPNAEPMHTTEASTGDDAFPNAMIAGAVSPPFVSVAAVAGPKPVCPTRVQRREPVDRVSPPLGWVVLPGAPDAQTLHCGNLSRKEWTVRRGEHEVEISLAQRRPVDDALPFALAGKVREGLGGTRRVKAVDGGFLVGFDAGEHIGALWWFGQTADRRLRLADENILGFAELGGVPVAITGLTRLGMSHGRVMRFGRDSEGAWRVAAWVDLGGASQTYVSESSETMLVLTTGGLLRITACGDMSMIAPAHYDVLYPSSMAVDDAGVVTIGMRHFTTRWIPSAAGYREEWLVRTDCAHPSVKKFECVCGG